MVEGERANMRLGGQSKLFRLGGVPLVGNLETGGIVGLTKEGELLCRAMAERDVPEGEVPLGCVELAEHLRAGGYLSEPGNGPAATTLRSAYLHVTQRCNLRCRFCYSEDNGRNALPDPSAESLVAAIKLVASMGARRLVISGGEPLLRPDLPGLAGAARDAGLKETVVLTNGLLVTREGVLPLRGVVDCLGIAFDGCGPDDVAHLRGSQRFGRLVEAVRTCLDAGIAVRIMPTLHAGNLGDLDRYAELARSLGASLGFSLLTAPLSELGDLALGEKDLAALGRRAAMGGIGIEDSLSSGGIAARRSCGAGVRTLSVAADGTIYPCHMLHDPRLAMGNAFTDDADAVRSSEVAQMFSRLDSGDIERCGSCSFRHLCAGGCRARAFLDTGSVTACDPNCELSRSYYERVGELLGKRYGLRGGEHDAVRT